MEQYVKGFERFHAGEDVRPVSSCKFLLSLSLAPQVGENPGNEVEYADDKTFILDGSQSSFSRSLYLLDTFALISGLNVNYQEAEALWIGSCKSSEITLPSLIPILYAKDKVYALGVWFSRSLSPFISLSFVGLPPTFSFSLSFSCSIFQICGHDN